MADFQQQVGLYFPAGFEGDFCSANPRSAVVAGEAQLVAGTGGLVMGRFAWADANGLVTNAGTGVPTGFVKRDLGQAQIDSLLSQSSMTIFAGREITLFASGDFWVKTTTAATKNQKIFASNTTGQIATGATGATISGFTETSWYAIQAGAIGDVIKMSRFPG